MRPLDPSANAVVATKRTVSNALTCSTSEGLGLRQSAAPFDRWRADQQRQRTAAVQDAVARFVRELRSADFLVEFRIEFLRPALRYPEFGNIVSITNSAFPVAADVAHGGRCELAILPTQIHLVTAARTQTFHRTAWPRLRQRGQQLDLARVRL